MKKYTLLAFCIGMLLSKTFGQNVTEVEAKPLLKESSKQKTANTKDILTTLFRAGIDNLLGEDHKYSFSSSFFGIDSIFRPKNSSISYSKERFLRQASFNIALEGDSTNEIAKFSGGFTFTLYNGKDIKLKKLKDADFAIIKNYGALLLRTKREIRNYIDRKFPGAANDKAREEALDQFNVSWNAATNKHDFSGIGPIITEALNDATLKANLSSPNEQEVIASILKGEDILQETYEDIAEKYARKPMITFSPTGTYDRINKQGEFSFAADATFGLVKDPKRKPWEVEIKSLLKFTNDTTIKNTNYDNKPLTVSAGVNKVLIQNEDKESKMEFKFFIEKIWQLGSAPSGKGTDIFTFNSTLRINVYKSLWLPLTIKYDPDNHNFLGYFSVTANIGN